MTPYEIGFADGERKAFDDKRAGILRFKPQGDLHERGRGFWDGYTPRSQAWALRTKPARSYHETERCA
jgi:hypothetical protein